MKRIAALFFLALPLAHAEPPAAQPAPLLRKALTDLPGNKEGLMLTVTFPPGADGPKHRHDAHTFVYVLEGTIVMQVEGGEPVTLQPGDTFYENPKDIHVVSRNASATEPAKFVVFMVKDAGAPLLRLVE